MPTPDEDLRYELSNAALGRIVQGPGIRELQPVRDYIAAGASLDLDIFPAIEATILETDDPLSSWSDPKLADRIQAGLRRRTAPSNVVPLAPRPAAAPQTAAELPDDQKLDPDDGAVMRTVEAVLRATLAETPPPGARNGGEALARIRRRLGEDGDFSAFAFSVSTHGCRVVDLRRGVREAIERRRAEPRAWADFAPFVQSAFKARLENTPRKRPNT